MVNPRPASKTGRKAGVTHGEGGRAPPADGCSHAQGTVTPMRRHLGEQGTGAAPAPP